MEAVKHDRGPMLILAGAGSGKTTVLVARAGRLVEEKIVEARELCVLTFTNKAARELKSRVQARLPGAKALWAGTFHSFCLFLLRRFHKEIGMGSTFGVIDTTDSVAIVKELLSNFNLAGKDAFDAEEVLNVVNKIRERKNYQIDEEDEYEVAADWVRPKYLSRLNQMGLFDFDGLILRTIELLKTNESVRQQVHDQYQQVMVDEFQDTNQMQMDLVSALAGEKKNLTVVGDDDQSIYAWRGAQVRNILDFPKRFAQCRVVKLEDNYRSMPAILNLANQVITRNKDRHPKTLRSGRFTEPGRKPEVFVFDTEEEESDAVVNEVDSLMREGFHRKEIAILYRSNSQGATLEAELRKRHHPYEMSGGMGFFDRKETRDVLAYLRSALRPNELALRRILNTPSRGIGDKTLELIMNLAETKRLSFFKAIQRWQEAGVEHKTGAEIETFLQFLKELPEKLLQAPDPARACVEALEGLGYRKFVEKSSTKSELAEKRWRFVELFAEILSKFILKGERKEKALIDFIDAMELRDEGKDSEEEKDAIQLLTLHACKGLEFPAVILMGVEEDLIPHKTLGTNIDEERRLFYVGITRAEKRLIMTRSEKRRRHGKLNDVPASRFLLEIPKELYVEYKGTRPVDKSVRKSLLDDLYKKLDSLQT